MQRVLRLEDDWDAQQDPEHVAWLARETVQAGRSVLIFCGTKKVVLAPEAVGVVWLMGLGCRIQVSRFRLNVQVGPQACGLAGAEDAHLLRHLEGDVST